MVAFVKCDRNKAIAPQVVMQYVRFLRSSTRKLSNQCHSEQPSCHCDLTPGGSDWGDYPPLKPTKVTLFTMILYNSENSICDIRPSCRPLFCHISAVKCTSFLLE